MEKAEDDLDKLMRKVLIDALEMEWWDTLKTDPPLKTSKKFQCQMKVMLADPFTLYRKKTFSIWKKCVQSVAVIAIVVLLGFSSLMVVSSTVRAAVIKWVQEWYDTYIEYRYSGENLQTEMPQYQISNLPEGYFEVERIELTGYMSVTYQNANGETLYLDYAHIQDGIVSRFETDDTHILDISVNGYSGLLFLSQDTNQSNSITWIDEGKNIQFTVDGFFDKTNLLYMAEKITVINSLE